MLLTSYYRFSLSILGIFYFNNNDVINLDSNVGYSEVRSYNPRGITLFHPCKNCRDKDIKSGGFWQVRLVVLIKKMTKVIFVMMELQKPLELG